MLNQNPTNQKNQSMEIAVKNGFRPGKDIYLLWGLKESLKDMKEDIKYHEKKKQEYRKQKKYRLALDREIYIDKICHTYFEIENLLNLFTIGKDVAGRIYSGKAKKFIDQPHWFCIRCGFLEPEEVTNDEKCEKCGGNLPI